MAGLASAATAVGSTTGSRMERGMERRAVVLIARRGSGRVFVPGVEIDAEACVRFVRRVMPNYPSSI